MKKLSNTYAKNSVAYKKRVLLKKHNVFLTLESSQEFYEIPSNFIKDWKHMEPKILNILHLKTTII